AFKTARGRRHSCDRLVFREYLQVYGRVTTTAKRFSPRAIIASSYDCSDRSLLMWERSTRIGFLWKTAPACSVAPRDGRTARGRPTRSATAAPLAQITTASGMAANGAGATSGTVNARPL